MQVVLTSDALQVPRLPSAEARAPFQWHNSYWQNFKVTGRSLRYCQAQSQVIDAAGQMVLMSTVICEGDRMHRLSRAAD